MFLEILYERDHALASRVSLSHWNMFRSQSGEILEYSGVLNTDIEEEAFTGRRL